MKYKIKDLNKIGCAWHCTLLYWNNCECNAEKKAVVIHQEKRPTKLEILNAFN